MAFRVGPGEPVCDMGRIRPKARWLPLTVIERALRAIRENRLDTKAKIGIVVIGRNEAARLGRALDSACAVPAACVLYVDSGSSDASVEIARSLGVEVLQLDERQPLSAARARKEGADHLMQANPDIEYLQFLDGDSSLAPGWVAKGIEFLRETPQAALVCGKLTERDPEGSVYNRLAALQWDTPAGEISQSGGIFLVRRVAYAEIGGFNPVLRTGEERELCARLRAAGHRLFRLDHSMAEHDLGFYSFRQWWTRRVWGGYGYAIEREERGSQAGTRRLKGVLSLLCWGALLPGLVIVGLGASLFTPWALILPLGGLCLYLLFIARIALRQLRDGYGFKDAALYGLFCALQKIAVAQGFISRKLGRRDGPDAHTASGATR